MEVRACMTRKVVSIAPRDTVNQARDAMHEHRIRHLPVCDDDRLVGVISERDTRGFQRRETGMPVTVAQIMNPSIVTIEPGAAGREAAALMVKHQIGALPVTDDGALVGIISETDILELVAASDEY
jgi:acetoin utilization protein AcuB